MLFIHCIIFRLTELLLIMWILCFYNEKNYMYFDNFCSGISPGIGLCCLTAGFATAFQRPFHPIIDLLSRFVSVILFIILAALCLLPLISEKYEKELRERKEWSLAAINTAYSLRLTCGVLSCVAVVVFLLDFIVGYIYRLPELVEII